MRSGLPCASVLILALFAQSTALAAEQTCIENWECPEGETCSSGVCVVDDQGEPPSASERPRYTKANSGFERGSRTGLMNTFWFGLAGDDRNRGLVYTLMLDLAWPSTRLSRYHLHFGYEYNANRVSNLPVGDSTLDAGNGHGLRLEPIVLGYEVPIWTDHRQVSFQLDVVFSLLQGNVFFDPIAYGTLSSGAHVQGVMRLGVFFLAVTPIGFGIKYFYWSEDGTDSGFGFNWPISITLGIEH